MIDLMSEDKARNRARQDWSKAVGVMSKLVVNPYTMNSFEHLIFEDEVNKLNMKSADDYMSGKRACKHGDLHKDGSDAFNSGYSDQYTAEQNQGAQNVSV